MKPVSVCGFAKHIIRFLNCIKIPDKRLIGVTDIAGEHNLLGYSLFCQPRFYSRRSQKMSHIRESYRKFVTNRYFISVFNRNQASYCPVRVFHVIKGNILVDFG